MTALDAPSMPACPYCGSDERVTRDLFGQKTTRHAYLCGSCWAVFDGSQDEWHHHKQQRDTHRNRQEGRGPHS